MDVTINESWKKLLSEEFDKPYFHELVQFVKKETKQYEVFPSGKLVFNAFDKCSFEDVSVVIIGQDPYHGIGQANGLCFSVNEKVKLPPSLKNIYKEIQSDLKKEPPVSGNLEHWAKQGVLMLNATLTVRAAQAGSHQKKGWEEFTDAVIKKVSDEKENIVFILWGVYAQKKGVIIDENKHFIVKSAHPSPFSAHSGFFGSRPFSRTNTFLNSLGQDEINW